MKRFHILILTAFTLITLLTSSTEASLTDKGDGLIYDDNLNVTWLQNANFPGGTMTWLEAVDWAESLVFQGYDDWRLPVSDDTCFGKDCTGSEIGHLFYTELGNVASYSGCTPGDNCGLVNTGDFSNIQPWIYWAGTEHDVNKAWRFNFKYGTQSTGKKNQKRYAWAVRNGDVIPPVVPEPVSSILFIAGGVTLAIRRRYRRNKENVLT